MTTEKKLSKKTLRSVYLRHYQLLGCFNYERQQSSGYAWTMMPAMRELYGDNPAKMKEGVKRHLEFFNCATTPSPFIIGITCAMEEQYASSKEGTFDPASINSVKTALMGPLAAIGDSFFWGTFRVMGAGIAAPLAVQMNALAPFIYFLINFVPSTLVRVYGFKTGYTGGSAFLTRISEDGTLNKLTEAAKILGLVVVGAMISSLVTVNLAAVLNINGAEISLQQIFDDICPQLLPLLLCFACYGLLQKKVSGTLIMVGLIVLGILGVAVGLL